ncbi:hypothetical protein McpSp1_14900 [Methanocorpusculaceae archaeon Sp1]|uniref:Uncharacterized protein n=1 Tax=Methanorbis furvi TaxID=3028299 RepID=A0AAE4SBF2_9EURY|nr:hypothetical protein [Methanocorpusculaceae archaeon Sp1]MDV0441470.1 hypothetical protein [Methanocorpusculaceae archaeon Ag1]
MSQRAAEALFTALFSLTDIRALLRETAPSHEFDDAQKADAQKYLTAVKKQIAILEEELL